VMLAGYACDRRWMVTRRPEVEAVGYVRVSSEEQARRGASLSAQREQIRAFCRARGWGLIGIESDEGVSGVSLKRRPGLQVALEALERGRATALVITKLDRLSRSVRDIFSLVEGCFTTNGASLVSIGESLDATTATGKAFMGILAVMAQMESELIGERTRAALDQLRAEGRWVGAVPYGKRRDGGGGLIDDQPALNEIRRAKRLRAKGLSWRELAERMGWSVSQARTRLDRRYRERRRRGRMVMRPHRP